MKISERVDSNPPQEAERRGGLKKKHKAYIVVSAVLVFAAVLTISLVLTHQYDTQQTEAQQADTQQADKNIRVADNDTVISSENETTSHVDSNPLFFFLGDSITEQGIDPARGGYIPVLQNKVSRSADVVAHGLSGYNTRWLLKYAMPVVEDEIRNHTAEKHVPVESYQENLVEIVRRFQALVPAADILLVTPPHVDDDVRRKHAEEEPGKWKGVMDRSNARSGIYARACVETANDIGVPVLDLYTYFNAMNASTRNPLLWDGLHFTAEGHEIVSELLLDKFQSEFPNVAKALESWKIIGSSVLCETDPWVPNSSNETITT
ncbi:hypothetical protein PF001_g27447 [Phytophthora fragariae]|uniref:SGNH hydrolase-type esterase domain-containing protein n=1 Tax=Phytophthora fragariae TaxID=53985 RepID=A0A6A4BLM9_9STRA|nr:hypothetical protein PF003_g28119 [Phytophthora fragariae]KAE8921245.1 hypothetical protein PF009_g28472 [Phytophthora fragariae]KAE9079404.1 hypothetical protein PF006_g27526 [Phytophthora fragariae]KAE9273571.1 hypothetical protein PF001_g27447 [Phytophthora fragariae]